MQKTVIEGPGMKDYIQGVGVVDYFIHEHNASIDCKRFNKDPQHTKPEGSTLKVFAVQDWTTGGWEQSMGPVNGVVRNVAFTNIATNEIADTICEAK